MDCTNTNSQHKKMHEIILTAEVDIQSKKDAIFSIIKMAVIDHSHFSFLLNQVDWFSQSNLSLMPVLGKVLRAYRGTSKTAPKVVYNLLAAGLSIPNTNLVVVDLLVNIMQAYKDNFIAIQSIKENYPHKVCDSSMHNAYVESLLKLSQCIPSERFNLFEIIVENLSAFDTEMQLGQDFINRLNFEDQDVLALSQKCGSLQEKYDQVLERLLKFVSQFDKKGKQMLLSQFYLIFEKVNMTVDNTKMIQYVAFYLAQSSLESSSSFLALLMITILENYCQKGSKMIFIAALRYLRSYLNRSQVVEEKKVRKIIVTLMSSLQEKLENLQKACFENLNLKKFGEQNILNLYLLESILFLRLKFSSLFKQEKIKSSYANLIENAHAKLHYYAFIDRALLLEVEGEKWKHLAVVTSQSFKTVYIHKFIPPFLKKSGTYIKMKMESKKRERPSWSCQQGSKINQVMQSNPNKADRKIFNLSTNGGSPLNILQEQF